MPSNAGFIGNLIHSICLSFRQVRQAERYNWAATRGVNEVMLLENLPEDLQRDIRRHLFKFVKKVGIRTLELHNMTSLVVSLTAYPIFESTIRWLYHVLQTLQTRRIMFI